MLLDGELWYVTDEARDLIIRLKSKGRRQPARGVMPRGREEEQPSTVATGRGDILGYWDGREGTRSQKLITGFCRIESYGKTKEK